MRRRASGRDHRTQTQRCWSGSRPRRGRSTGRSRARRGRWPRGPTGRTRPSRHPRPRQRGRPAVPGSASSPKMVRSSPNLMIAPRQLDEDPGDGPSPMTRVTWPLPVRSSSRTMAPGPQAADLAVGHLHLQLATEVEVELAMRSGVPVAEPAGRELEEQRTLGRERRRHVERRGRRRVVDGLAARRPGRRSASRQPRRPRCG